MDRKSSIDIDTKEDIDFIKEIMNKNISDWNF